MNENKSVNISQTLSKWSLFLGILSLFTIFFPVGIVVSIAAITFAVLAKIHNDINKMQKKAVIGVILGLISIFFIFISVTSYVYIMNNTAEFMQLYEQIKKR